MTLSRRLEFNPGGGGGGSGGGGGMDGRRCVEDLCFSFEHLQILEILGRIRNDLRIDPFCIIDLRFNEETPKQGKHYHVTF